MKPPTRSPPDHTSPAGRGIGWKFVLGCCAGLVLISPMTLWSQSGGPNWALHAKTTASSTLEPRYSASNAVDGVVSDDSRWVSREDDPRKWLELDLGQPRRLGAAHVYSGWQEEAALANFTLEAWQEGQWRTIPGANVTGNVSQRVALGFAQEVTAQRVRLTSADRGPVRLRELALFSQSAPLGSGVIIPLNPLAFAFPTNQHLVALNQVGYDTAAPKRFTAPLSPDGSRFEVRAAQAEAPLFSGVIHGNIGDFTAFQPTGPAQKYVIVVSGGALQTGRSDAFAVGPNLWQDEFWQTAIDFMIDCRSVVGTHPSAYGGCPWRDGTYYAFEVPSLILMVLADPDRIKAMPVQINWAEDKARVLAPDFKFDPKNPNSEGVLEAVRRYYSELEPPKKGAPDAVQLVHWGLGYYLFHPATRDPSDDPLPQQIHSQTVEQFAYLLYAWPQLEAWLPRSFYDRCHEFAFAHWKQAGLLEIDPLWDPKTYLTPEQIAGHNPTGGSLHPYKGRHAPGHSIQPNLLMYEVARRAGRADADIYLQAARTQTQWLVDHLDWDDPRTTKGQRMSEFKTITSLAWFLERYPDQAPAGLRQKITHWAQVMIQRSENLWDFRRYDLQAHWTIPQLNETGNLVSFTASALAASWIVEDPAMKGRLRELAFAQMDNVFGRNPRLAAAPHHPEKGFPLVKRGWPKGQPDNTCARLETTRGSLSASPGTEMYPFNPEGRFRHPEGWVNYNAAWNVALAYLHWEAEGSHRRNP